MFHSVHHCTESLLSVTKVLTSGLPFLAIGGLLCGFHEKWQFSWNPET